MILRTDAVGAVLFEVIPLGYIITRSISLCFVIMELMHISGVFGRNHISSSCSMLVGEGEAEKSAPCIFVRRRKRGVRETEKEGREKQLQLTVQLYYSVLSGRAILSSAKHTFYDHVTKHRYYTEVRSSYSNKTTRHILVA